MARFDFSDGMLLGLDLIDSQHRKLFDLINELAASSVSNTDHLETHEALLGMSEYLFEHFKTEENYMREFDYSGYESHRQKHAEFVQKTLEFHEKFRDGKIDLENEILRYLVLWFIDHVKGEDQKFVELFRAKGL